MTGAIPSENSDLSDWLAYIETVHSRTVDLSLDRVRRVAHALRIQLPAVVISVAGTNGKGSSVALLESMLCAMGQLRVGAYTSPHLVDYEERVRIDGTPVEARAVVDALSEINRVRGVIPLTYFEFGTLAALRVFERRGVGVAVLEVGMGGRLDAVNIVDPTVSLITAIDIDHSDWLGRDRESIGREKAGILRHGGRMVCTDLDPPKSLIRYAEFHNVEGWYYGSEFRVEQSSDAWTWVGPHRDSCADLPLPALPGSHQLVNASGAIAVLHRLPEGVRPGRAAIKKGLESVKLPGRLEVYQLPVQTVVDVGHNHQAITVLRKFLEEEGCSGTTRAVFSMLNDKDIEGAVEEMKGIVGAWYVSGLPSERGLPVGTLAERIATTGVFVAASFDDPNDAFKKALADSKVTDRVVVFGSFYLAGAIIQILRSSLKVT